MDNNSKPYVCVFAKHDCAPKEYIFAVPYPLKVYKGDILLVDTMQGRTIATATSDIFESPEIDEIAKRFGAYLPLKNVIQVCGKEIKQYIKNATIKEMTDKLNSERKNVDENWLPF